MAILAIPVGNRTINCHMTSLVKSCLTFQVESYQDDFAVLELWLCRVYTWL